MKKRTLLVLAAPAQARDLTASSVPEILQDLVGAQAGDSITIAPGEPMSCRRYA